MSEPPAPIAKHRRDAPPDLAAAVERALAKRPDDRWQNAGELRDVLAGRHTPLFAVRNPKGAALGARQAVAAAPEPAARPLTRREARDLARAQRRAARGTVGERDLSVRERIRRIRHLLVSYAGTSGVLLAINASVQGEPWFLIPTAVMGADILRRFGGLWADGIRMSEVFRRPERLSPESDAALHWLSPLDPERPYGETAVAEFPPAGGRSRGALAPALATEGNQPRERGAQPAASVPSAQHALSPREVRERLQAEAQMRVDVEEDRNIWGRATSLRRRFQKYRQQVLITASSAALSAGAFLMTMAESDFVALFIMTLPPLIYTGVGLGRKTLSLRRDDVDPADVLSKPLDTLVREYDPAALLGQVARDAAPGSGMPNSPYMAAVRRATLDRAAILEAVRKMGKSDRRMLPDVVPTVNALVERIASLAPTLHRLDGDLQPDSLSRLDERIADVERQAPRTPEADRKLALLTRQRSSVQDLMQRRETLLGQLESAGLLLQNLKLDLIKVGSAGVQATALGLNNATQEARALSTEIGYVLGAADEIRKI